ncbi:DMT family transporter [Laspinema olomoucense]|uniref:DMT family transporter n=1 Tax=Laspinema olomoucense D3b TaxID=2953688 RepID=A0ABT2NE47_9CYAN|nr:DMT family transporter [Laspinema sp. D3b]MCT7980974.1 DMT family transporter [Laspinema sp. D3b]
MLWFFLAISTAIFTSLQDVLGKRTLQNIDATIVAWSWSFFTALVLLPVQVLVGIPDLGSQFGVALAVGSVLNAIASVLYIQAISTSDLSLCLPLIAFSPLFMAISSPIIVGEWLSWMDGLGIGLIVGGSYLLNLKDRSRGYFAPFQALVRERGPKLMLVVALLWSITANVDKVGVQNSSPLFWSWAGFSAIALLQFPLLFSRSPNPGRQISQHWLGLSLMGLCTAIAVLFQMLALKLTLVVQVIAIKRTSVLFGVLWGKFLFHESGIRDRFWGATTMLIGVVLMTLF